MADEMDEALQNRETSVLRVGPSLEVEEEALLVCRLCREGVNMHTDGRDDTRTNDISGNGMGW